MNIVVESVICLAVGLLVLVGPVNSTERNKEADFQSLMNSLHDDDLQSFSRLLEAGADPNYIGEMSKSEYFWVMCRVTQMLKPDYLDLALAYGGDPLLVNPLFENNAGAASAATPIACSISSRGVRSLKRLVGAGADAAFPLCQDCNLALSSLIIHAATLSQYDKVYWLLSSTFGTTPDEMELLIKRMERKKYFKGAIDYPLFLKTAEHLRELGYEVTLKE